MQAKIYRRLKMKEACRSGTPLFCGGYLSECQSMILTVRLPALTM